MTDLAISPTQRRPGLGLLINFLASAAAPGTGLKGLVIAEKSSSGSITADTELKEGLADAEEAGDLLGPGVPGHTAVKRIFEEYPNARLDLVSPLVPSGGVAATATVTFDDSSPVTAARSVTITIAGVPVTFIWTTDMDEVEAATAFTEAVNDLDDKLPLSAANGGGTLAVSTLTFKFKGDIGNDVTLYKDIVGGAGGSVTLSGATMASGAGIPTLTNVLNLIAEEEYAYILLVTGNADANTASESSGPSVVRLHINAHNTGQPALLQNLFYGVTGSISGVKTGSAQQNAEVIELPFCQNGQSLPCEWGAAEMGQAMREEAFKDPAVNRAQLPYRATLVGARDLVADSLTGAEIEDLLYSGVTPITYTASKKPRPDRPITTYFKDDSGNPDDRILDVSRVRGAYAVARDLRTSIPQEFPQKKISPDLEEGDDPPPEDVVQISEVRAFVITRLRFWQGRGVLNKAKLDTAIADNTLIVEIDDTDAGQVNIVVPYGIVRAWVKTSVVMNQVA